MGKSKVADTFLVSHFAADRERNLEERVFKYSVCGNGHMFEDRLLQ